MEITALTFIGLPMLAWSKHMWQCRLLMILLNIWNKLEHFLFRNEKKVYYTHSSVSQICIYLIIYFRVIAMYSLF
jgi:hypothetical protein